MNKEQSEQNSGKLTLEIVPSPISDYMRSNFKEGLTPDIYVLKGRNGTIFYRVDILAESIVHHLKFNSTGTLILDDAEPLIELFDPGDDQTDLD